MSAIPIDYVICTHTKNILDFSGQAPTRLRPWPVWLSLLQLKLQPYLTLVDAVWLQPRPKVLPHFAASLVQLMPRNAKCRWPARRGNICFCHCHRAQWMQRQPSTKAKSAFPLGSKSSALDALECPAQMAHTPAQHVCSAMTIMLSGCKQLPVCINDTCGVQAHALSEWRLEPPP